jgi:hypothetical protein
MKKGATRKAGKGASAAKAAKAGKRSAAKATAKSAAQSAKAAAKKPVKASPAKASAKPATAKATAKKPAKASAKAAPAKAAAKPTKASAKTSKASAKATTPSTKPAKAAAPKPAPAQQELDLGGTPLDAHAGRAMIIQILGDAEAYFIDFSRLSDEQRQELVEHHLAAWDARKRAEGEHDWADSFVPVALIGESMPPDVRGRFDLSAPHEGVVLFHRKTGALLHASSKDDDQLAVMAPDIETISPAPSFVADVFDPSEQSFAYRVDRTESEGFTRANIVMLMQTGGADLILV